MLHVYVKLSDHDHHHQIMIVCACTMPSSSSFNFNVVYLIYNIASKSNEALFHTMLECAQWALPTFLVEERDWEISWKIRKQDEECSPTKVEGGVVIGKIPWKQVPSFPFSLLLSLKPIALREKDSTKHVSKGSPPQKAGFWGKGGSDIWQKFPKILFFGGDRP